MSREDDLHFAFCGGKIIMDEKRVDIMIVVKDGLIQSVYASQSNCHVDIFDIDGISHLSIADGKKEISKFNKLTKNMKKVF